MEQKLKKVLFITNIPAPYRIDFYEVLGKFYDLTVLFEAKRAPGITFNWKEEGINNFYIYGRGYNAFDVLEAYVYYMIKPEFQDSVRLKMMINLE